MLRRLYMSPLGRVISLGMNLLAVFHRPFMAYGVRDQASGHFRKRSRISSSAALNDRKQIAFGDDVWIGHHCVVDGSGGVHLGDGVQLASGAMVFSHGSQDAVRLHGKTFIEVPAAQRIGYTRARVIIGDYCFIGAGSIVLAGTELGKGCLVAAGSIVSGKFPPFSILVGGPAIRVGDVRDRDSAHFANPVVRQHYFDRETIERMSPSSEIASDTTACAAARRIRKPDDAVLR